MSLLTSFTRPVGGAQFDFVDNNFGTVPIAAAGALAANSGYFSLVRVARPITVSQMTFYVGGASGNCDVGIYDSADGGTTLSRLASSGTTAVAGTNAVQTIAFTAPLTLAPGKNYWLAFAIDNATATIGRVSGIAVINQVGKRYLVKATSFVLPTSVSTPTGITAAPWLQAS